jgi:hypothetical protein
MRSRTLLRLLSTVTFVAAASLWAIAQASPQVHLDADGLTPRPIEQLTGSSIVRYYAQAWGDLATAMDSGQTGRLGEEFVGFAKDRLTKRIAEQKVAGLHIRIVDHGHQLRAVFYSSDGTSMQLIDHAQLEVQTFDGDRLLDTDTMPREYMVLMTPGADRWYVRDLQEVSVKPF